MITIHVSDSRTAGAACNWCLDHLPITKWAMTTNWPGQGLNFKFDDLEHATVFSLKWSGVH